jgi:hypothetical protein
MKRGGHRADRRPQFRTKLTVERNDAANAHMESACQTAVEPRVIVDHADRE